MLLPALGLTVAAYLVGVLLQRRSGKALLHPVGVAMLIVVAVLACFDAALTQTYLQHNAVLLEFLMVAIVAFAIPLVDNIRAVTQELMRLLAVVLISGLFIAGSTVALCWVLNLDLATTLAFSLRSVTNPIVLAIAEKNNLAVDMAMLGGFITGIVGVVAGEPILRALKITDPRRVGLVLGITCHTFGIARSLEIGSVAAAYATVGMIFTGVFYAFAAPWVLRLFL
ncbi:MAG TPA: LrgB family protein [Burkholderiales bacterium]|nr:LrgB family protein [Burkholderiales bacterium]